MKREEAWGGLKKNGDSFIATRNGGPGGGENRFENWGRGGEKNIKRGCRCQ